MKLREIFRFELAYQLRRIATWVYFVGLFVFGFGIMRSGGPEDGVFLNTPAFVAFFTVMAGVIWLLLAATVAGDAAARDIETRIHPLTYTAPVSKLDYLGGRFLAAFVLNAAMLFAIQIGFLLSFVLPGMNPGLLGPFQLGLVTPYLFIALPNAFVVTAIQFSVALRYGRAMAAYLASMLLIVFSLGIGAIVAELFEQRVLGKLIDLVGFFIFREMESWTPIEKNTASILLQGTVLANRLLWIGVALGAIALTYRRFRFDHQGPRRWSTRRITTTAPALMPIETAIAIIARIAIPEVPRRFGFTTYARQTLTLTWAGFRTIARSRTGLTLVGLLAVGSAFFSTEWMLHMEEIPLLPRTDEVVAFYAPSLRSVQTLWIVIPLLLVFYAGELVWQERDSRVSEIIDTSPIPDWVLFLGKFLALGLVIIVWLAFLMAGGMLVQVRLGYPEFDLGLYIKVLFGLQLVDYLLFALLVLVMHVVVNQKHLGHVAALATYGFVVFARKLGFEHKLLVYGSDLGWSYTPMAGFGPQVVPWLWFKLYWAAWALLLAVAAKLLFTRGREADLGVRLRIAHHRFTRATAAVATTAVALILAAGGFILYNTNVLNSYLTAAERAERRVEYERKYGPFEAIPQPQVTRINLRVEIHPDRREAEIRGIYQLVNNTAEAIDSIHLAPAPAVTTGETTFNRAVARAVVDEELDHRIYSLTQPLQPGDTLELRFDVRYKSQGFTNNGLDDSIATNGTYFTNLTSLPRIGYQSNRELSDAAERRAHGLAPQPALPPLDDAKAIQARVEHVSVETIVGTDEDQIAVAPGALRRSWTEEGRRYSHYVTDAPIGNEYAIFSANYAVHEAEWTSSARAEQVGAGQKVAIQVFHHPGHTHNLVRLMRSAQASLTYYTSEFGPYPFSHVRFIEHPGRSRGMHADNNTIDYQEGFSLLNSRPAQDTDLPFVVIAHEVAHQWWGTQLVYARVEGAGVLSESLATYSSMRLLEAALGAEELQRYLRFLRLEYELPQSRALPPLLRATGRFLYYRKGPLVLYGLSEYIGKDRLHAALRRLLEKHSGGKPPLPTTLDLYRELKAVTPDEYQTLLHDLFAANTFWELRTEAMRAARTATGEWQVTLDLRARKIVVDLEGRETEVPMDDWVEVGVYAANDELLYLQKHRVGTGRQTMTVTVSREPDRAGIDPRHLLNDWQMGDNVASFKSREEGFP